LASFRIADCGEGRDALEQRADPWIAGHRIFGSIVDEAPQRLHREI
jgi:hypothetical protein